MWFEEVYRVLGKRHRPSTSSLRIASAGPYVHGRQDRLGDAFGDPDGDQGEGRSGKYIVLNSGFTFRGYGSNATQVPRLPDYAVIDTNVKPNTEVPGGIPLAGFFNEEWQLGY